MFYKKNESNYRVAREGVRFKSLACGTKTHLTEFRLSKRAIIPKHSHPHEQTGYLVSGRMKFTVDDGEFIAEAGDGWSIAGNTEHGVDVLEDCVVVEVFSPPRKDYLP